MGCGRWGRVGEVVGVGGMKELTHVTSYVQGSRPCHTQAPESQLCRLTRSPPAPHRTSTPFPPAIHQNKERGPSCRGFLSSHFSLALPLVLLLCSTFCFALSGFIFLYSSPHSCTRNLSHSCPFLFFFATINLWLL